MCFGRRRLKRLLNGLLERVLERLDVMETNTTRQFERIIQMNQETITALKRLDTATNDLGARVAKLQAKLASGTAGDDPAIQAELNAISARLESLAADPANPVPPEPPIV